MPGFFKREQTRTDTHASCNTVTVGKCFGKADFNAATTYSVCHDKTENRPEHRRLGFQAARKWGWLWIFPGFLWWMSSAHRARMPCMPNGHASVKQSKHEGAPVGQVIYALWVVDGWLRPIAGGRYCRTMPSSKLMEAISGLGIQQQMPRV
eukprot:350984-Chlamydomonas_euryale.AAC.1